MHRAIWIWAAVLALGRPGLALSQAPEQTIFGPKQYEQPAAGTSQAADTVAVPADVTGPFTLRIRNGAGEERVNAGWVYLNGVQIVGPADFHPQVDELERPVPLQAGNELIVVIRGRAGTRLSLAVSGRLKPPVIDSVAPENGSAGTLVTLTGAFFDPVPANNHVAFAGADAQAAVIAANASQVTVRVPELAASGPIALSNSRGTAQSTAFTLLPLNTRFTATRAGLNAPLTRLSTPVTPFVEGANPGDSFIFDLVTLPTKGTAFRDNNNRLSYQATAAINEVDLFTYRATFADGSAREGTARVKAYNQGNLTACTRTSTLALRTNVVNCAFYGEVVTRTSATGAPVTVQYIAVRPSSGAAPKAAVFLIGGGDFNLIFTGSAAAGLATFIGANFLVRTAQMFADAGYLAIAMNGPSDLPDPAVRTAVDSDLYRVSVRHAVDILMVLREVNTDGLDVFLAGTSRGAISAVATNLIGTGIALSSPVTKPAGTGPRWIGDPRHPNLQPGFVQRPSHVLWNTLDQCFVTVPADSQKLADDLGAAFDFVTGGLIADPTDQCGSQHYHGFYAIEPDAVGKTTAWLDGRVIALAGNKRPDAAFALLVPAAPGVPLQIDLAALTGDADGDVLSYTLSHVGSGRGGTVTQSGAVLTYTPPADATGGTDNFVYVVTDGRGGVNAAVIRIRIGG